MKKVLIINGHEHYDEVAVGSLTKLYIDKAEGFLEENGFEVKHSVVESEYNWQEEVDKFVWADYIIFQYPVYWMGLPAKAKAYIDAVFTHGHHKGLYESDGRSRHDTSKQYGSGGSLVGTKYMLSMTYNCPTSEFDNKEGFFDGLSLDEANIATHKTFEFVGAKRMQTYSVHDIFKGDLDIDAEMNNFTTILQKNFL